MFREGTMAALFLELAKPDDEGCSRPVYIGEFSGEYEALTMGNGGSWCRDSGPLGKKFNIERIKEGGKIVAVQLHGYNTSSAGTPIPLYIRQKIAKQRCKILATGNQTEADHKNGRKDDPRLSDTSKVTMSDFQPLSKTANDAKRQHCKECKETGKRFDAKRLGYKIGQVRGGEDYEGTCVGCYWHDPFFFNQEISSD